MHPDTLVGTLTQEPEATSSYCGPATAQMILNVLANGPSAYDGKSLTQQNLANNTYLHVDQYGNTPWALPAVMAPTLNMWMSGQSTGFYVADAAPSLTTYDSVAVYDIDADYPFALNIHETASGTNHLSGYPTYEPIDHWMATWGYDTAGPGGSQRTAVADPAYSTAVSWGIAMGQPYRWINDTQVVSLVSPHGTVW